MVGRTRTEVSAHLHGRLLIVGLRPAEDLHHLPDTVTEVVGSSPVHPCDARRTLRSNTPRCRWR